MRLSFVLSASVSLAVVFAMSARADSGACSWHGGIDCGAGPDSDGSVVCADGWSDSSTLFNDASECRAKDMMELAGQLCDLKAISRQELVGILRIDGEDLSVVAPFSDALEAARSRVAALESELSSAKKSLASSQGSARMTWAERVAGLASRLESARIEEKKAESDLLRAEWEVWGSRIISTKCVPKWKGIEDGSGVAFMGSGEWALVMLGKKDPYTLSKCADGQIEEGGKCVAAPKRIVRPRESRVVSPKAKRTLQCARGHTPNPKGTRCVRSVVH